jgi:hypothetical protein
MRLISATFIVLAFASSGCGGNNPESKGPGNDKNNNGGNMGGNTSPGTGGGGSEEDAGTAMDDLANSSSADLGGPVDPGGNTCVLGSAGAGAAIPGPNMAPGAACVSCHKATFAKSLYMAGTVFTGLHEPDNCKGVSGLKVVVTDAQGKQVSFDTNASGNFVTTSATSFTMPFRVAVVNGTKMRKMVGEVSSGDCNSCHNAAGKNGAPGRIQAP